jgi:hypothetical protein
MKAQELLLGLLKLALVGAGLYYTVEVALAYTRSGASHRPVTHRENPLRSARSWLIRSGVVTVSVLAKLAAPVLDALSEASAEVGEWAISRRHAQH